MPGGKKKRMQQTLTASLAPPASREPAEYRERGKDGKSRASRRRLAHVDTPCRLAYCSPSL